MHVAAKQLDRQRNALGVAQQPRHHLTLALLAVAIVAERGQLVAPAFKVTAGDVVKKDRIGRPAITPGPRGRRLPTQCPPLPKTLAILLPPKKPLLDFCLIRRQPIEVLVKIVLVERFQIKHVAGGVFRCQPHGRQPRTLADRPRQHLPQRQFALPRFAQRPGNAQLLGELKQNPHRPHRKTLSYERPGQTIGHRRQLAAMLQRVLDRQRGFLSVRREV